MQNESIGNSKETRMEICMYYREQAYMLLTDDGMAAARVADGCIFPGKFDYVIDVLTTIYAECIWC